MCRVNGIEIYCEAKDEGEQLVPVGSGMVLGVLNGGWEEG